MSKRTIYLVAVAEAVIVVLLCLAGSFLTRGGISLAKDGARFVRELRTEGK